MITPTLTSHYIDTITITIAAAILIVATNRHFLDTTGKMSVAQKFRTTEKIKHTRYACSSILVKREQHAALTADEK